MKDMRYMKTPSTINKPWKNKQSDYDECGSSMSYISDAIERAAQEMRLKYEETEKEFVAFSRKLLRTLKEIRELLDKDDKETALRKLNELIEDTQKDIEA